MNTTEKLQLIRAKCVELLAIAEKRTPGEWVCGGRYDLDYVHNQDDAFCVMSTHNALFIASCVGHAEAGWRSTIALIDHIVRHEFTGGNIESTILSAWPDQLLSSK